MEFFLVFLQIDAHFVRPDQSRNEVLIAGHSNWKLVIHIYIYINIYTHINIYTVDHTLKNQAALISWELGFFATSDLHEIDSLKFPESQSTSQENKRGPRYISMVQQALQAGMIL